MNEIENAEIVKATVGMYDYGYMSYMITIKTPGGHQVFGTYDLRFFGMEALERILKTVGVDTWDELEGQFIRIDGSHRKIEGIGNIVDDRWYYPEKHAEQIKKKKVLDKS